MDRRTVTNDTDNTDVDQPLRNLGTDLRVALVILGKQFEIYQKPAIRIQ